MTDDRHTRKARSSRPWARLRDRVLRASTICHLCGQDGADTADHIVPVSHGGRNTIDNVAPAHRRCNEARGTLPVADAIAKIRKQGIAGTSHEGGFWHVPTQSCCPHSEPWAENMAQR